MKRAVLSLTRKGEAKLLGPAGAGRRPAAGAGRRLGPRPALVARPDGASDQAAGRADDADLARLVRDRRRRPGLAQPRAERAVPQHALGSFEDLLLDVTIDPAMLVWLSGNENEQGGAERELRPRDDGAVHARRRRNGYTEDDVREQARALTGWTNDWDDDLGDGQLPLRARRATTTAARRSSARRGNFDWRTPAGSASSTRPTRASSSSGSGRYFVPRAARAKTLHGARSSSTRRDYEIRPRRRGDPHAPGLLRGPARWSSRRSS